MFEPVGISLIVKLYGALIDFLKLSVYERDNNFWKKRAVMFLCNTFSQTC